MKVICCEASGDWAVAIRRKLPSSVSLVETRSLAELADRVQESPSAMVSIEWSAAKAEAMLAEIARIARKYPHAVVIVLANRDPLCPELACREAGALHLIDSLRRAHEIADIAALRLRKGGVPDEDCDEFASLEQKIWASLPWRPVTEV